MKLSDIPMTDKKTYQMLASGQNCGVFQLSAPWIRGILRDVKPTCFEDLVIITALIRPGSLDNGGAKLYAERRRQAQAEAANTQH